MVRRVKPSDKSYIVALVKKYALPFYPDTLSRIDDWIVGTNFKTTWVDEQNSQVVAVAVLSDKPDRSYAKLSTLIVSAKFRHQNIGLSLLKIVEQEVLARGKRQFSLTISEKNKSAINFFRHHGFDLITTLPGKYQPGVDEYVLAKNLLPKTHIVRFRQEDKPLFLAVKSGRKSVETRSATKAHLNLLPGDFLKCVCGQDVIVKKITKVAYFPSVEALFKEVPISKVMPDTQTLEEAKKWYGKFPGHLEKIAKFGLVAFFLKKSEIIF